MDIQPGSNTALKRRELDLQHLFDLIRIPSISTLAANKADIQAAAGWLMNRMREIGLNHIQLLDTETHPVVYGDWLGAGEEAPVLLIYGHYDVQPVDPVSEWKTPPFEPTLINGSIYGRGTSDDKGQAYMYLAACEAYLQTQTLPVNVKFFLEGSEESGSRGLETLIAQQKDLLACDAVMISDGGFLNKDTPAITTGVRGNAYFEVEVSGPEHDLHSGSLGGVVHNPLQVLVEMLASLHDSNGKITIPGLYDRVVELTPQERIEFNALAFTDAELLKEATVPSLWEGEKGYTSLERLGVRPSLSLHGISGGFTDPGMKTVIPARVTAKLSIRLVPDQDPLEIVQLFKNHIHSIAPKTVHVNVRVLSAAHPAVVNTSSPFLEKSKKAYLNVFGKEPVLLRSGGSIPVVGDFQNILNAPVIMMGFGFPDDNLHAPNEKFSLDQFYKGIQTIIHYFAILGK